MDLSIIICTYNHCDDLLKPCLKSIEANTDLSDAEVLIVANGCTDNTMEYVCSLSSPFHVLWYPEPLGFTVAANKGLRLARGDYIIMLNNDTTIHPHPRQQNWVNMMKAPFLQPGRKVGLTGSGKFFWYYDFMPKKPNGEPYGATIAFWNAMFKRSLVEEIGYLDEKFSPGHGEDVDFCYRAEKMGYEIVRVPRDIHHPREVANNDEFPICHKGHATFADIDKDDVSRWKAEVLLRQQFGISDH